MVSLYPGFLEHPPGRAPVTDTQGVPILVFNLKPWFWTASLLLSACGEPPPPAMPVVTNTELEARDRLASNEVHRFASWLVAQEGDGVVLLLPLEPITTPYCSHIDRGNFGQRWDAELSDRSVEDPLKEGGLKPMSKSTKDEIFIEDPMMELKPQLEILPAENQLPFADLPGESLYFRGEFGSHTSFDLWDSERRSSLPLTDEMMDLIIGDWQSLTRNACQGQSIPESAWGRDTEPARQHSLARARRIGLRYLVVDTELYGEIGMGHLAKQVEPHMAGRFDFNDGTGITVFELYSPDVVGRSLREGSASDPVMEQ